MDGRRQEVLMAESTDGGAASGPGAAPAVDPVCGMTVDPATSAHHATHAGADYHFCSARCRERFVADPRAFLARSGGAPAATGASDTPDPPAGTMWTCPMHPEVRQDHPGACPICGMALEPELAAAVAGPSPELIDMTRRFRIALALTLPVFVLAMGGHLFPALHHLV